MPQNQTTARGAGFDSPARPAAAKELVSMMADLSRLARVLSRDGPVAEDLAQEALARVWARIAAGAEIDDLRPYLMAAARNLARRPARRMIALSEVAEPAAPPEAPGRIALHEVMRALSRLPARDRRMILRLAGSGESYAEIARAEGLPIGTVMSRLARIRLKLRDDCGLPHQGPAAAVLADSGKV